MSSKEQKAHEEWRFDLRVIERRLRKGEIEQKEYSEFLKKLADDESRAEYIEVYEEPPAEESTLPADELAFT